MGEVPRARNTAQNTLTTWHADRLYGTILIDKGYCYCGFLWGPPRNFLFRETKKTRIRYSGEWETGVTRNPHSDKLHRYPSLPIADFRQPTNRGNLIALVL